MQILGSQGCHVIHFFCLCRASRRSDNMEGESWMDIRSDRQKGMNYTELARKYHLDPCTATGLPADRLGALWNTLVRYP